MAVFAFIAVPKRLVLARELHCLRERLADPVGIHGHDPNFFSER